MEPNCLLEIIFIYFYCGLASYVCIYLQTDLPFSSWNNALRRLSGWMVGSKSSHPAIVCFSSRNEATLQKVNMSSKLSIKMPSTLTHTQMYFVFMWRPSRQGNIFCRWLIKPQQAVKQSLFIQCISQTRVTKCLTKPNRIKLKQYKMKGMKNKTTQQYYPSLWSWQDLCLFFFPFLSLFFLSPSLVSQVEQCAGSLGLLTSGWLSSFPGSDLRVISSFSLQYLKTNLSHHT